MSVKIKIPKPVLVDVKKLKLEKNNVKVHDKSQLHDLGVLYEWIGFTDPVIVDRDLEVWAGKGAVLEAIEKGMKKVPVIFMPKDWDENKKKAFMLQDNKVNESSWIKENVQIVFDEIGVINFEEFEMKFESTTLGKIGISGILEKRFIVPPFSVLDSRQGYWKNRKDEWLSLGFKSESGRIPQVKQGQKSYFRRPENNMESVSIFDPVLCEIFYYWFSKAGDTILDPFAGGSVRGLICSLMERKYVGIDLSKEQIQENKTQTHLIPKNYPMPIWINDTSENLTTHISEADFVFSCPPYFDIEKYSDNPNDLSNMTFDRFCESYQNIIKECCSVLKEDRFACFVLSDIRDKRGYFRNLIPKTIEYFQNAGMELYNNLVYLRAETTAGLRASYVFPRLRKTIKTHDNILVFYKGNIQKIRELDNKQELGLNSNDR